MGAGDASTDGLTAGLRAAVGRATGRRPRRPAMVTGRPRDVARAVVGAALRVALRCSDRKVGVALLYHGVGGPARPEKSILVPSVPFEDFAAHVRHLCRRYRLVAASELQAAAAERRRGQRLPVAITFDDDDAGYVGSVLPVLTREAARAAFLLNGASLDRPRWFWWERLQAAWDRGLVDEDLIARLPLPAGPSPLTSDWALRALGEGLYALPPSAIARVQAVLADRLGEDPPTARMGSEQVRRLVDAGHEIGFHTREHPFLPVLDDAELARSLSEGREALERLAGAPLTTFAYPSGGSDARFVEAVRRAGYPAAFTTRKAPVTPGSDPLALGRIVPQPGAAAALSLELGRTLVGRPRPS
ncbi:MAG: polysaccharide deacetylase family protein [Solirubrobacteraceae bacterium]